MNAWASARVARVLGTADPDAGSFSGVSTDTRTLAQGALFVALEGERFDAHEFLGEARRKGATAAVVRRGTPAVEELALFEVDDTLVALGKLAHAHRQDITGPVVAITGTNGKTATKEMVATVLGTRWVVYATRANLNNLIGVPLTILQAGDAVDALVVEAGASVPGEIARLKDIIAPSVAVVTNASLGHTEGFGSLEGVLREKLALVAGAPLAVVGTEPEALAAGARRLARRTVVAGTEPPADVRPDAWMLDEDGRGRVTFLGQTVRLPLVGRHQIENAMIALAVGVELGVGAADAVAALADVRLPMGRCEVRRHGELVILDDTYNANPASMLRALEAAQQMRGARPLVVVLGTMLELGEQAAAEHVRIAQHVVALEPSLVAAVGEFVPAFGAYAPTLGDRLITAGDPDTLGAHLAARLTGDELVLVKASRGVKLERTIAHLIPRTG